jgi:hypothetical protein
MQSDIVVRQNHSCWLGNTVTGGAAASTPVELDSDDTVLWHMRLEHLYKRGMFELHKWNLLKGVKSCKLKFCKYCVYRKQRRVSFKVTSHTSKGVLDYIHLDVWRPAVSSNGSTYCFVSFIDDCWRNVWVYFMTHKSEESTGTLNSWISAKQKELLVTSQLKGLHNKTELLKW